MDIDPETRPPVPGAAWIPLSKGLWALVDDWLVEGMPKFYAFTPKDINTYYGQRQYRVRGQKRKISDYLHRYVWAQYRTPIPEMIDHINRMGWDCRRENLRMATGTGNQGNQALCKNNTSGYKGVQWSLRRKLWVAEITVKYKKKKLGGFIYREQAARVYDAWAKEVFGEFAWLNFPDF